jgi:hypothetical protein
MVLPSAIAITRADLVAILPARTIRGQFRSLPACMASILFSRAGREIHAPPVPAGRAAASLARIAGVEENSLAVPSQCVE